ncbi:MAG: capsular biosynthesis protein CpsI [Planctomycetes bacterium TMED75]|nr:capsular biosynthesis protein CpsI [Planctomycetaceae bacterium]OUU90943.1 MAG: capsular biosynthesis protein CpsI [Planctomycetes bacterium TMED75]
MTILLTGAAGFIGSTTAHALLDRGEQVIGLDDFNDYYDPKLKEARAQRLEVRDGFQMVRMKCEDRDGIADLFEKNTFDRVIHLAAQAGVRYSIENPFAYVDANISGFMTILEGCRHHEIKHLVYASSSSVYGGNKNLPFSVNDSVDHPMSMYAATKKANELMAHTYSNLFGLPTTGLRFFTVYGPWGRPDMALFIFTRAIIEGKPLKVFNHGKHTRDFTYVDDIVEGVIRTLDNTATPDPSYDPSNPNPGTSSAPWRVYNIGGGQPVELLRFIELIEQQLGKKATLEMLDLQPGDVPDTRADVAALKNDIDYQPSTTVDEGIPRFVDWYCQYHGIQR